MDTHNSFLVVFMDTHNSLLDLWISINRVKIHENRQK